MFGGWSGFVTCSARAPVQNTPNVPSIQAAAINSGSQTWLDLWRPRVARGRGNGAVHPLQKISES